MRIPISHIKNQPNLPEFEPIDPDPESCFNNMEGTEFRDVIDNAYEEIIKWRKNLFKLPSGKAGKCFVKELTYWLEQYNKNTKFQGVAIKVFMTLPSLLLQKSSKNSKAKEHTSKLEERMKLWNDGKINKLLKEGQNIQKKLLSSKSRSPEDNARIFSGLMFKGKINAAL